MTNRPTLMFPHSTCSPVQQKDPAYMQQMVTGGMQT